MVRRCAKVLAVLMAALLGMTMFAGQASANPSRGLYNAALQVVNERQGGPLYAKYKKQLPKQLNWGHDGCSVPTKKTLDHYHVPGAIRNKLGEYKDFFTHSCDRHDFGYRNFGSNTKDTQGVHPKLDTSRAMKDHIDDVFLSNMGYQCWKSYKDHPFKKAECQIAAKVFWGAVHLAGDHAYGL